MLTYNLETLLIFGFVFVCNGAQYVVYPQDGTNIGVCSVITDRLVRRLGSEDVLMCNGTQRMVVDFWLINATESQRDTVVPS